MAQELDKWQQREARALAEEEGISFAEACSRVLGRTRPRKGAEAKATPAGS